MNTLVTASSDTPKFPAKRRPKTKNFALAILRKVMLYGVLGYLAILGAMLASERYLVYPGSKYPKGNWSPVDFNFEEVEFQSADGTNLVGWYLKKPTEVSTDTPDRTILVCHGNAENVAESAGSNGDAFRRSLGADVFEFDYRGYGKCKGTPNESRVLADSEAALAWICKKTGKKPADIIIVGHSLGGGPAVHLAAKFKCQALILQRTFSSMTDTAQYNYPWLPVRYLMRNQYESFEKIRTCECPLYQSHGTNDTLIPLEFASKLFRNSPAKQKKFNEVAGMGHWDPLPQEYWNDVKDFVDSIEPVTE